MDIHAFLKDYLAAYTPYKKYWNYEDGCVLIGCIDIYKATGMPVYKDFVMNYLSTYVAEDGSIPNYEMRQYNIDSINCGKALFFALDETGEERYRKAIEFHMQRLREHPRCQSGNFWHKEIYPNQIWLDGLYMAQPFYMAYEKAFDKYSNVQDITSQFKNVRRFLYNEEKGLSYHAFDEARIQPWANKETGLSANFWLRSMGWYLMAMIDCIDLSNKQLFEHYKALVDQFRESISGILQYQDPATGMFYQVIDHAEVEGNYLETSGSSMIAYALLKGVRIGVLNPEKYLALGLKTFEGIENQKIHQDADGQTHLGGICAVAGLSDKRDGSVAYYLSEPIVDDDSKGVGPFMMAFAEYEMAKNA